ncbi:MAG TPA: hypothetical protein VE422_04385 [Terriglobia bacterium]|nr:hypothetical protein [Terriglobia bacterium]
MMMRSFLVSIFLLIFSAAGIASDPVAELQQKIKAGEVRLEFDSRHGYLSSVLKNLKIPVSSQTLVFSKTSLQTERISPATPRAMYFNDDVYVAWVPDGVLIEIMSVDPRIGSAFYVLAQEDDGKPLFERSAGHECSVCHYNTEAVPKFVPRLLFSSVLPDATGNVEGAFPIQTTDQSLFSERWGGWYVTGTHGVQKHLGNVVVKTPASAFGDLPAIDFSRSSNVTDLSRRFDTTKYLSPHSDIVALMVLAHQIDVQNLIAFASGKAGAAARDVGEPIVKAMLFAGAPPLTAPIRGTSNFAAEFADQGPRDGRGRSLRDLDLKTRLFRYPLSYLIYGKAFDEMPELIKAYVYRRLREVLTGEDKSKDFAYLTAADRTAILEILRETKTDFPR